MYANISIFLVLAGIISQYLTKYLRVFIQEEKKSGFPSVCLLKLTTGAGF